MRPGLNGSTIAIQLGVNVSFIVSVYSHAKSCRAYTIQDRYETIFDGKRPFLRYVYNGKRYLTFQLVFSYTIKGPFIELKIPLYH